MASSYPGAFDSFPTITADKLLSDAVGGRAHRAMHNDMGDVIEAMQAELGLNPSGAAATVAARLNNANTVNVKDYGATGNGSTDDSAAIRSALTAGAGKTVVFPAGTYLVSQDGSNLWCLSVPADTRIVGPGTLKLAAGAAISVSVFRVGASGVTFDALGIDGNKDNNTTDEHRHGILGNVTSDLTVFGCRIVNCTGDGVLLNKMTRVGISYNYMSGHERNAVTLYGDGAGNNTTHVRITDNYLACAVQPVDSEPENSATTDDITVTGNTLVSDADYGVTVSGSRWSITGNRIQGGVYLIDSTEVSLLGNTIIGTTNMYASTFGAVDVYGGCDSLTISNNTIKTAKAGHKGIAVFNVTTANDDVVISGNAIAVLDTTGIECRSSTSIITGNTVTTTTSTAWEYGIYVRSINVIESAVIVGNSVEEFDIGIGIDAYTTNDIKRVVVAANNIAGAAGKRDGIRLSGGTGGTHLPMCVVAQNVVTSTYATPINEVDGAGAALKQGFYATTPIAKPTVTGSRGGNAALASLCTALASLGLITDSTT